jgi:DNA-binding protein H-NS
VSKPSAAIELTKLSIEQLIDFREELDRLIKRKLGAEKQAALAKLDLIRSYETRRARSKNIIGQKGPKRHRAKAAPRYRDPITGKTWAGRGVLPRWMQMAIEAGKKKEDFKM